MTAGFSHSSDQPTRPLTATLISGNAVMLKLSVWAC
jgi:hypothetical protein